MTDVKYLKFLNGEFVIAQVVAYKDGVYSIKNPIVPQLTPVMSSKGTQQVELSFSEWPQLAEIKGETLEIKETSLLVKPLNPIKELTDAYNEKYGSGLVLPFGNPNSGKLLL